MGRNQRLSTLEEIILDLIKNSPDANLSKETIKNVLQLSSKKELRRMDKAINSLSSKQKVQIQGNTINLKKQRKTKSSSNDNGLIEGRIQITPRGTGFVIVEGMDEDIRVHPRDVGIALPDDIVKVKLSGNNKRNRQPTGKIVDIAKRGKDFYVGTLKKTGAKTFSD